MRDIMPLNIFVQDPAVDDVQFLLGDSEEQS
jgi:hypothetical protein